MNALFLLLVAIIAFAFGFRFYAKILALAVFRLQPHYSTPAHARADDHDFVVADRHMLFGHHVAALTGTASIAGGIMAVVWGWIPAFLWLVVATAVAGAVYGLGCLWMSVRAPGISISELTSRYVGPFASAVFWLAAATIVLLINAAAVYLAADLLKSYPGAALPFWLLVGVALIFGRFIRLRTSRLAWIAASAVSLVGSLLLIQLFRHVPFAFSGEINLDVSGFSFFSLNANVAWMGFVLAYVFFATRAPVWKFNKPHGFLTSLLLLVALVVFCVGVLIERPILLAPDFNTSPDIPGTLPWLFITLGAGAIAGFHLLIIHAVTAKQLDRESDARTIGYGGALVDGMVALSAVIIASTAFTGVQQWSEFFTSWEGLQNLRPLFGLYIEGFTNFAAAVGVDAAYARTVVAVLVISLVATTLEAGLRVQKHLLSEFGRRIQFRALERERVALWVTIGLTAVVALWQNQVNGAIAYWPYFGVANLILASLGLLLITLSLRHFSYPVISTVVPAVVTFALAIWAILSLLVNWYDQDQWLLFILGLIAIAVLAIALWEALRPHLAGSVPPP